MIIARINAEEDGVRIAIAPTIERASRYRLKVIRWLERKGLDSEEIWFTYCGKP